MRKLFFLTLCTGAVALAGCDGETPADDGGMDGGMVEVDSGPPAVCGDEAVTGDEQCDDGNTTGGDGCSADCLSDETCGNGVTDPGEVCDDGNSDSGDGCSADCSSDESCGNSLVDFGAGERCDDGNMTGGDGCSADCTSDETCGNGVTDTGESCDDGNTRAGDGCDAMCRSESCTMDSDCDDSNPCNGVESCPSSTCVAGTPLSEGASCGVGSTREICIATACVASACGDGFLDPGASPAEACDDGNMLTGDGCDGDCLLESCTVASDCDDGNPCTAGHGCPSGTCVLGARLSDGTVCDADSMPSTRDVCIAATCAASVCGDGYVDAGTTPAEECDDGNTASGDGCNADCTIPPVPITAYRLIDAELMDPHLYAALGPSCTDITNTVNTLLDSSIADFTFNGAGLFRPLDIAAPTTPVELVFGATCTAGSPRNTCGAGTGSVIGTTANNTLPAATSCFTPDPSVLNPSYTRAVNSPHGPCFVTDEQTFMINLGGVVVTLTNARMSATYGAGATPVRLINGVVVGFISEAEARATTFDPALPLVGGDTLYQHLADGGAPGSACESITSFTTDDSDTVAGTNGFWLHLNFVAALVDWTP